MAKYTYLPTYLPRYHTWPDLYQPNEVVVSDQQIDDKNQITEVEDVYLFFRLLHITQALSHQHWS